MFPRSSPLGDRKKRDTGNEVEQKYFYRINTNIIPGYFSIIGFGFRIIWRIIHIQEGVIHCGPRQLISSWNCIFFQIIRNPVFIYLFLGMSSLSTILKMADVIRQIVFLLFVGSTLAVSSSQNVWNFQPFSPKKCNLSPRPSRLPTLSLGFIM